MVWPVWSGFAQLLRLATSGPRGQFAATPKYGGLFAQTEAHDFWSMTSHISKLCSLI